MSEVLKVSDEPYSLRLATYLNEHGYAKKTVMRYIAVADRFQSYLRQHPLTIEAAKPANVESYLQNEVGNFRRRHGKSPTAFDSWCHKRTAPVHILLRIVQGQWPPALAPNTSQEVFHTQLIDGCSQWLADCRGLAARTIAARRCRWKHFLDCPPGLRPRNSMKIIERCAQWIRSGEVGETIEKSSLFDCLIRSVRD